MSSSLPSGQNRSQELFSTIPFITKGLLLFNVSIFILMFLFSIDPGYFAISAFQVLYLYEFYRIFSSAFVHMSILHIGMNMLSLFQLGSSLEKQFGSLQYFFLTLGSVFTAGFIYILLSWSLDQLIGHKTYPSVGFSGILFTYAVVESFHTRELTRSVFGCFNVPAKIYPFVLLILLQIIIPRISFMGHLSGCIVGLLTLSGCMNICFLPSEGFFGTIEVHPRFIGITRMSGYILCNGQSLLHPSCSSEDGCCAIVNVTIIGSSISYLFVTIGHLCEAGCVLLNCPIHQAKEWIGRTFQSLFSSQSYNTPSTPFTNGQGNRLEGQLLYPLPSRSNQVARLRKEDQLNIQSGSIPNMMGDDDIEEDSSSSSQINPLLSNFIGNGNRNGYVQLQTNDTSSSLTNGINITSPKKDQSEMGSITSV